MQSGPKKNDDTIHLGYDTGESLIPQNTFTYKGFRGEPTTNHIPNTSNPSLSTDDWPGYGWSGGWAINTDVNAFELTSLNGWHNHTYNHGQSSGTIFVSFDYKLKYQETSGIWGFVLNGTHLGSYVNWIGSLNSSNNNLPSLTEWQTFTGSYTGNSDTKLAIGLRGNDSQGLSDTMYIKNLQVETKSHRTPYTLTSRSNTNTLIDIAGSEELDLSNMTFNSNAQMDFDGTNDWIEITSTTLGNGFWTIEMVAYLGTLSNYNMLSNSSGGPVSNAFGISSSKIHYRNYDGAWQSHSGNTTLSTNTYYHLVWVNKNNSMIMYVNGEADSSSFASDTSNGGPVNAIGRNWFSYFDGRIPIFKYYKKSLSPEQIRNNYEKLRDRFGI
jgi:hypothetical protein